MTAFCADISTVASLLSCHALYLMNEISLATVSSLFDLCPTDVRLRANGAASEVALSTELGQRYPIQLHSRNPGSDPMFTSMNNSLEIWRSAQTAGAKTFFNKFDRILGKIH